VLFLVDAQLPPALARWLTGQGHAASRVVDLGLERADDRSIWDRAVKIGAVILAKDEDVAVRKVLEAKGPSVVWVRFGNTTRAEVLVRFEQQLPLVLDALSRGEGLVAID
jgi:predicted nuclease of predicted toxin-antitoxin system